MYEDYAKLMFDLQVLAHQTDLTRITTFMLGRELSGRHTRKSGAGRASSDVTPPECAGKTGELRQDQCVSHADLFAYYVDRLRATADGDGSLLDHMILLVWRWHVGRESSCDHDLRLVLLGGGAGKGRPAPDRYPADTPLPNLHLTLLDSSVFTLRPLGDSTGELEHSSLVVTARGREISSESRDIEPAGGRATMSVTART